MRQLWVSNLINLSPSSNLSQAFLSEFEIWKLLFAELRNGGEGEIELSVDEYLLAKTFANLNLYLKIFPFAPPPLPPPSDVYTLPPNCLPGLSYHKLSKSLNEINKSFQHVDCPRCFQMTLLTASHCSSLWLRNIPWKCSEKFYG